MNKNDILEKMPQPLADHLRGLMEINNFDSDEEQQWKFMDSWLQKRALFDKIIEHNGFILTEEIPGDFKGGFFLLTYSGSLITVSPADYDGNRNIVYESIGIRSDTVKRREFRDIPVRVPIRVHSQMFTDSEQISQTSPILAMAVEPENSGDYGGKDLRILGERISRSLITVNQALFSKQYRTGELEKRDELFGKWIILTWFRTGGWEEAVFLTRAKILFLELFSNSYNIITKSTSGVERDEIFLELVNKAFPEFIDRYKWLESEKQDLDIGLMKAMEKIPNLPEYKTFLDDFLKQL